MSIGSLPRLQERVNQLGRGLTIGELIDLLAEFDADAPVYTQELDVVAGVCSGEDGAMIMHVRRPR